MSRGIIMAEDKKTEDTPTEKVEQGKDEKNLATRKKKNTKEKVYNNRIEINPRLEEETEIEEALDRQQRRQRAITMRRYKSKIAAGRRKAERRPATMDKLKKRARKKAIEVVRKKVAQKQGENYATLDATQKANIDKKVEKKKALIDRLAKRFVPQVRSSERERMAKRRSVDEQFEIFLESVPTKRFHQARNKDGSIKLDRRFRAFKKAPMSEQNVDRLRNTHKAERQDLKREQEREMDRARTNQLQRKIQKINREFVEYESDAELLSIIEKVEKSKDDPCWKGYVQLGTKKKNGKEVPNCVPESRQIFTLDEQFEIQFLDEESIADKALAAIHRHVMGGEDLMDIAFEVSRARGVNLSSRQLMKMYNDKYGSKVKSIADLGKRISLKSKKFGMSSEQFGAGFEGTDTATQNFKADTPGEKGTKRKPKISDWSPYIKENIEIFPAGIISKDSGVGEGWVRNAIERVQGLNPTRYLGIVRGLELEEYRLNRNEVHIMMRDRNGEYKGFARLVKNDYPFDKSWIVKNVAKTKNVRGRIMSDVYAMIMKSGYMLAADNSQTMGGASIWTRLAKRNDIIVYAAKNDFKNGMQYSQMHGNDFLRGGIEVYRDTYEDELHTMRAEIKSIQRLIYTGDPDEVDIEYWERKEQELRNEMEKTRNKIYDMMDDEVALVAVHRNAKKLVESVDLAERRSRQNDSCDMVTVQQMKQFEKLLDKLFEKIGIDFEFTKHFRERMSDERNNPCITLRELAEFMKKMYAKKGKPLKGLVGAEAVLKDMQRDLNIPVVIKYDERNDEIDLIMKTIMRKKNFRTPNKIVTY
jgi:hypothetical protein